MTNENENTGLNSEQANFGMPGGYFQRSAISIANKIEWEEEHKDLPTLIRLKDQTGFIVPENYFLNTENKLELLHVPKLLFLTKNNGFAVPENYFEERELIELTNNLPENKNELLGFEKLAAIKKQNSFKVNKDYFSDNEQRLQTLLRDESPARVFKLFNLKISYAAAAFLVLALGMWTYNYYFKTVEIQDCGTIACIDKADLLKARNLENMEDEELYELVNPNDLEKKLNNNKTPGKLNTETDSSKKNAVSDDLLDEL